MDSDTLNECHGAQGKKADQQYQGQLREIRGFTPNYFKATWSLRPSFQLQAPWQSLQPSQSIKLSLGCLADYRTWMHGIVIFVTTSMRQDRVSCAPATFIKCGSRFSSSPPESSANSWLPVIDTVGQHPPRRRLIEQKLE